MDKFKIGDKVRVKANIVKEDITLPEGVIYRLDHAMYGKYYYFMDIKNKEWAFPEDQLELISDTLNPKFKPGDLAWSPYSGFALITEIRASKGKLIGHGTTDFYPDGRASNQDKHSTLLTVKEAAKLGYYPPKKKVKKTKEIWINQYPNGCPQPWGAAWHDTQLEAKGKAQIGAEQRKFVAEWEEEE